MSLWVNRVRQLALFAVALFFFSCTDEINLLGYKNPNSKFDVKYIELPVASSVLLFDTLRTSNYFFPDENNRLLVGKYVDAKFGDITASTCTQFYANPGTPKPLATAYLHRATINLTFDYYSYGQSKLATQQELGIYELDQDLSDALRATYKSKTPIIKSGLIATKSFVLDPAVLQSYKDKTKDTTLVITLNPAESDFSQRLFQSALDYRDGTDTSFVYYSLLTKKFPGIAIVPNGCDKVFGFNPSNTKSSISLYYKVTSDTVTRVINLIFASAVSYSNIVSDRSGTELAALAPDYQDFKPADSMQYIQSGTGVLTKLDMGSFLEFSKDFPNMIINSAELVIGSVVDGGSYDPPQNLSLRVLNGNNLQYAYDTLNAQSVKDGKFYGGTIVPDYYYPNRSNVLIDNDNVFNVVTDDFTQLKYTKAAQKYNVYLTRFLQQVYNKEEGKTQLRYFVLYPQSPVAAKSINRVVFPKDNIKLRVYYTVPTVND